MSNDHKINTLSTLLYLCNSKVAPEFHGIEVGVGEGLLKKVIVKATGRDKSIINAKYTELGDLGSVAEVLKKTQNTLFGQKPKQLTVSLVRNEILRLSQIGSQEDKMKIIDKLLVAASALEAKYLIRCMQGKLRIG